MISIGNTIVSEEVIKKQFSCDLHACHGECCVQGDSGAPLEEEISIIEDLLDDIEPFMTEAGKEVVRLKGVFDYDEDGDFVTTLENDRECAFVYCFRRDTCHEKRQSRLFSGGSSWKKTVLHASEPPVHLLGLRSCTYLTRKS